MEEDLEDYFWSKRAIKLCGYVDECIADSGSEYPGCHSTLFVDTIKCTHGEILEIVTTYYNYKSTGILLAREEVSRISLQIPSS